MIVRYIQLLVSMLVDVAGNVIDSGFTNSIGINEICIFGIVCSVHGLCYTVSCYGTYVFRITGKNGKECLLVSSAISAVLATILIIAAPYIKFIWYVEPEIQTMLTRCIRCLALCEIPRATGVFYTNYMQYTSQNKLCTKMLLLFYALMFVFDAIGLFALRSLEFIILGTGISNLIYSIISHYASGLNHEQLNIKEAITVLKTGFGYFIERIFSRLSRTVYEIGATYLGTIEYAIFVVAVKAIESAEVVMNTLQIFIIVNMRNENKVSLKQADDVYKQVRWVCILLFYGMLIISAFVVKGDIGINSLIIPIMIGGGAYITSIYYIKAYCVLSVLNDKKKFATAGIIRMIVSLGVIATSMILKSISMYVLLTYFMVVYGVTGFYIQTCVRRMEQDKIE